MVFSDSEPLFNSPVESQVLGIHKVKLSGGVMKQLSLNVVGRKAICYPQSGGNYLVFIELLHSVN
jgi:hypothetical protein